MNLNSWQKPSDDLDVQLWPEGCDDCAKESIMHLFEVSKNEPILKPEHMREYVKLVCKEAALKKDFPKEVRMDK